MRCARGRDGHGADVGETKARRSGRALRAQSLRIAVEFPGHRVSFKLQTTYNNILAGGREGGWSSSELDAYLPCSITVTLTEETRSRRNQINSRAGGPACLAPAHRRVMEMVQATMFLQHG